MQLIKKIISWIISLFHMIFKKDKKETKKSSLEKKNTVKNNNKIKGIVTEINETIPSYMYLSSREKDLLISRIKEIKKLMQKKGNDYFNKEIDELISILDECIEKDNSELKEMVNSFKNDISKGNEKNNKQYNLLMNYLPKNKKEEFSLKYSNYYDNSFSIKNNLAKIDSIINTLEKKEITLIEKNHLIDISDNYENSKNNIIDDIENYNKDMHYVMENINKNIISKVKLDYKKVNYITLSTELLDEIQSNLKKIEDNYKSHLYNKHYYEREINKIKKQILELKDLKNKPYVYNEILRLRKELYTKSKDKYDILYNNEIFMNINEKCDDLISKVNAKVVDIKKEDTKKENTKKKNEYLKNILLRFQDMALARDIILESEKLDFNNDKEMILYIKNMYDEFSNDIDMPFNFNRNKDKTELVVLFNRLNKVNCHLKKEKYISIEHINFRMNDLVEAVNIKNEELNNTMRNKYNIDITNQQANDKINGLLPNKNKILVKQNDNK